MGVDAADAHLRHPAVSQLAATDKFISRLSQGSPDGIASHLKVTLGYCSLKTRGRFAY